MFDFGRDGFGFNTNYLHYLKVILPLQIEMDFLQDIRRYFLSKLIIALLNNPKKLCPDKLLSIVLGQHYLFSWNNSAIGKEKMPSGLY